MHTLRTVSLSDLSLQKSPEGSVFSPVLFTLHDILSEIVPPVLLLPEGKAITSKTKGKVVDFPCNLTPSSNLTADSQAIEQVDKGRYFNTISGPGLHF